MEVLECIKTRRSIRKYLNKPVSWDLVSVVLEAGRLAPSSGNLQNWKFVVVLDQGKRKALADACLRQLWMETAPVHIVICAEPEKSERHYGERGEKLYAIQNCAAVAQNMLLEAHNIGLGACWVGAFEEDMIRKPLGIPSEVRPQAIITLGYSDEEPVVPTKFPIEVVCYLNSWRSKIKNVPAYMMYYSPGIKKGVLKGKELAEKGAEKTAEKAQSFFEKLKQRIKERNERKKLINQP